VSSTSSIAHGADISWLTQLEALGSTWVNASGTVTDAVTLLQNFGVDSIRLRVMVNPGSTNYEVLSGTTVTGYLGYCDQAGVVTLAQRCASLGITKFLIDFHFSDTWASDENQAPPAAWAGYSLAQLQTAVSNHVTSVLTALKTAGITPTWVQLGNEITDGILFGTSGTGYVTGTTGWANLAALLNAGYAAVKAVDSSALVILHLDKGGENAQYEWWFDNYKAAGGKWDVVGMSFYPYWQPSDTVAMLLANMNDMVSRYGKPVMVCEVGGLYSNPSATQTLLTNVKTAVASVTGGNGLGVFYWEPESNPAVFTNYSLGAAQVVSGYRAQFTSALQGFNQ